MPYAFEMLVVFAGTTRFESTTLVAPSTVTAVVLVPAVERSMLKPSSVVGVEMAEGKTTPDGVCGARRVFGALQRVHVVAS